MTFYQGLRIKTRPQLKKNGKLKRKHYILFLETQALISAIFFINKAPEIWRINITKSRIQPKVV